MNNFLFDKESNQITALLDFDWAQIGLPAEEIMRSFQTRYARLPGPYEQDPDLLLLRHALLHGIPSPLPAPSSSVRWDVVEMWDKQLAEVGAERASTIEGIETLSGLYELMEMMIPYMLCDEVIVKQRNRETMEREREEAEELLERFLVDNQA